MAHQPREERDAAPDDEDLLALLGTGDLRDQDAGPASTAATAVILILVRDMLKAVRQLVPGGNFGVLKNPMVTPPGTPLAAAARSLQRERMRPRSGARPIPDRRLRLRVWACFGAGLL